MVNPLNNGEIVVFVSFCPEIMSISERNASNYPEIVEKFEVFVVLDAISVELPRFFGKVYDPSNNERMSYALHFLKRTFQRFASKTLQNDSK